MATSRLTERLNGLARALMTDDDLRRAARVDRGLDNQGNVILDDRDFIPVKSPDGSVWRIRVSDTGVITANKVIP